MIAKRSTESREQSLNRCLEVRIAVRIWWLTDGNAREVRLAVRLQRKNSEQTSHKQECCDWNVVGRTVIVKR
jgi:hypothetical protein